MELIALLRRQRNSRIIIGAGLALITITSLISFVMTLFYTVGLGFLPIPLLINVFALLMMPQLYQLQKTACSTCMLVFLYNIYLLAGELPEGKYISQLKELSYSELKIYVMRLILNQTYWTQHRDDRPTMAEIWARYHFVGGSPAANDEEFEKLLEKGITGLKSDLETVYKLSI